MDATPGACSLDPDALRARLAEWARAVGPVVLRRQPLTNGIRLTLRHSAETAGEIERLIALEQSCCAWIRWSVEAGDPLRVEATTDRDEGVALLHRMLG